MQLTKPTLLLDKEKSKANIHRMVQKAKKNNIPLRPHFKTHQSATVGLWFKEEGISRIAVSSIGMGEYFAQNGWEDIMVAFPVNILEAPTLEKLGSQIQLSVLAESVEAVDMLATHITSPLGMYIKIDAGYKRTGVWFEHTEKINQIIERIEQHHPFHFKGFVIHAGHSYGCRTSNEIANIHQENVKAAELLNNVFRDKYPAMEISVGDTPTCSVMDDFSAFDEMRPGNFVYYDYTQKTIGSCSTENIAVAMACPVVAVHPERNEVILYGGAVHFDKDQITNHKGQTHFGQVVENTDHFKWGNEIADCYIKKLSQEHGTLHVPDHFINSFKVGDIVKVLPVHSCMTANVMERVLTTDGELIEMYHYNAFA